MKRQKRNRLLPQLQGPVEQQQQRSRKQQHKSLFKCTSRQLFYFLLMTMLLYLCILSVWITSKTTLTTMTSTTSMSSSSLSLLSSAKNSTTVKDTGNVVDEDGRDLRIAPSKACLRKRGSMEFQEFCQACRTNT